MTQVGGVGGNGAAIPSVEDLENWNFLILLVGMLNCITAFENNFGVLLTVKYTYTI